MNLKSTLKKMLPLPATRFLRSIQSIAYLRLIDRRKYYALPEREHLKRLLTHLEVDCVFDVGANAGQYAQMLRGVGYKGRIISFEPVPSLAETVRRLAAKDTLWTVEEMALDETAGEAVFNVMNDNQFSSLGTPDHGSVDLFRESNRPAAQIKVRKETLTTVYARMQQQFGFRRPFLKMDTQGFDVRVLAGGKSVAGQFVGLQSELAVKRIYREAVHYRDAISYYEEMGFELSAFVANNAGHFPTLVEMDCIMINKAASDG